MKGPQLYGYVYPKNIEVMASAKILVPDIADRASFALDEEAQYAFVSGYGITLKDNVSETPKYILGLLNSKVLDFYLKQVSTTLRGGFFRYFTQFIEQLPIRTIDFLNPEEKAQHDKLVSLVANMFELQNKHRESRMEQDKEIYERQIKIVDAQIDRLVCGLYGLTKEEIRIVEENERSNRL